MHTILGANGVIGHEISHYLSSQKVPVRQVSRNPRKVHDTDETLLADLLDAAATARAVEGSDVVYLVAGLQYKTPVWEEQWPRIMRNTIDACKRHGARMVFFDNVYAYGLVEGAMTEETPYNPCSKKGELRARIATTLLDEISAGELQAMIVRAADFYGPRALLSITHAMIFDRIRQGKAPQWPGRSDKVHTFTYTPDAGRATAMLAMREDAYGQTWHAPTTAEALTGKEFAGLACELAGRPAKLQVAPRWMLRVLGLFMPVLRENDEMMYQYEHDYRFDSSKFTTAFGMEPTAYRDGIAVTLQS
ncbi:NAD-dependent epimerase/dehydratase family protein [bacterium]|nr:NAD-dependent epimerase/dehydratase family protein [bacterium]